MFSDPVFLTCATIAVIVVGLAKGGFSGIGVLGTPILALAIPPVEAAAILLPILIVQDVVSVWAFRQSWNRRIIAVMLPGATVGIGLGYAFAAVLPVTAVLAALGLTSMAFGIWRLWVERSGRVSAPSNAPEWVGALFGAASGFVSQIAHSGAPPFQMWVAPKQLPHAEFVGTSAIFFAAINWIKVPAYIALGEFSQKNLWTSLLLIPLAMASTWAGVLLVRRLDAARFYRIIYMFMIGLGLKLVIDAFR